MTNAKDDLSAATRACLETMIECRLAERDAAVITSFEMRQRAARELLHLYRERLERRWRRPAAHHESRAESEAAML